MKNWFRCISLSLFLFILLPSAGAETLETVIKGYIAAQGGEEGIQGVHSLRLEGVIEQEGHILPFIQIKKAPDLMRTTLDLPQGEIISGFDGQIAWMKSRRMQKSIRMGEEATRQTANSAPLFSQFYSLRENPKRLRLLGETEVEGEACYEVQARPENGNDMVFFISKETFLECKVTTIETSSSGSKRTEIYYSDNKPVPPLTIPYLIKTYSDGQLINTVRIEKATINPGVLSSYFSPPGGLLTTEEQERLQHPQENHGDSSH